MGQADVIDFLRINSNRFYTEQEISKALEKSRCKTALRSLRKFPPKGFIFKRIRNNTKHWTYIYQMKKTHVQ